MRRLIEIAINYLNIREKEYRFFYERFLMGKRRILDAGCGVGNFIQFDPVRIEGVDHNPQSLRVARQRGYTVKKSKVSHMPYQRDTFDGIFCAHVIEHLMPDDVISTLYEFDRVLKKKGILVISAPLLYSRFYNDLTHIKPYPPEAILDYLMDTPQMSTQRTALRKPVRYVMKTLLYRYDYLYYPRVEPSRFSNLFQKVPRYVLKIISLASYRVGIKNYFCKNGYTLVLEKQ